MFDNESVSYINNSANDDYSDYNYSNSNRNIGKKITKT
jgi:hypothetical protein